MTGRPTPDVTPEELDRIEELVRYLAEHDGRMPTDDLPLAWWLVDALDLEQDHPVRRALADIPVTTLDQNVSPKKAHAWNSWLRSYDQLVWINRGSQALDDALARDKALRTWFNDVLSRHHVGTLPTLKSLLLERNPLWDPERLPDTKSSKGQMAFKIGINAVRKFYLEHKHTEIPEGYTVAGLDVHQWWHVQRSRYASDSGMKEHLRQQFARLGKLGVDLRTDKERAATDLVFRYRDRLEEIAKYIGKHGMSALPQRGEPFVNLARQWIMEYGKGRLDPALQVALEAIDGWTWGGDSNLLPLREYALKHGHLDIERSFEAEDGRPLGSEIHRIRKEWWMLPNPSGAVKRLGRQVEELAAEGWTHGVQVLADWHRQYRTAPAADLITDDGFHLGAFVERATRMAGQALLSWQQLRDLSKATHDNGWLETDPKAYRDAMKALADYARIHRHCQPAWERMWEDADLCRFILRVCADHDADDLPPSDVLRLEALPGWAWSRYERIRARQKAPGRRVATLKEPVRSVRTDVADPNSKLNRSGLRQFLPGD